MHFQGGDTRTLYLAFKAHTAAYVAFPASGGLPAILAGEVWEFFHDHIIRGGWGVGTLAIMDDEDRQEYDAEVNEYLAWLDQIARDDDPWT